MRLQTHARLGECSIASISPARTALTNLISHKATSKRRAQGHGPFLPISQQQQQPQRQRGPSPPQATQGSNGTKPDAAPAMAIDLSWDADKEESRKFRRTVFDFQRWRAHRSSNRYWRHIVGLLGSRIARGLAGPLWCVGTLSLAVAIYETSREQGLLPAGWHSITLTNPAPFNLSSFALSLLLVFRTNSSYGRWDEARKLWGGVINRSRDLQRQAESWFPEQEKDLLALLQRWDVAFSRSLQTHLREDGDIHAECGDVLPVDEMAKLAASTHRPNYTLLVLGAIIEEATIPDAARVRMDENLTFFADAVGACERILKTPIPLTWTRHTSRFLVMWLCFLPFTMWNVCGWGSIPASVAIAFFLLGIEEIGVQIEEPFSILAIEAFCTTIRNNSEEMATQRREIRGIVTDQTKGTGPADLRPRHERRRQALGDAEYDGGLFGNAQLKADPAQSGALTGLDIGGSK